jgi:hypothetical protein
VTTNLGALGVTLYEMPAPNTAKDVAGVGATLSIGTTFVGANTGALDVNSSGQGVLTLTGLPNMGPGNLPVQVTEISFTFDGMASGGPFTRMPTSDSPAATSLSVDTYSANADGTGTSSFTPTGAPSLPFAPKLSTSVAVSGPAAGGFYPVNLTTSVTQAQGEAAIATSTLTVPASLLSPNLAVAVGALGKNIPVGSAVVTSPFIPSPGLKGTAFFTGSIAAPALSLVFPAPFPITLTAAINLANNSFTFNTVPDIPITGLAVTLNSALQTNCQSPTGTLTGAFTGQNGAKTTASAPINVTGCPSAPKAGAPTLTGVSLTGLSKDHPRFHAVIHEGSGAPALTSMAIGLPTGLSFNHHAFGTHMTCTGSGKHHKCTKTLKIQGLSVSAPVKSATISGGKLVITFKTPVANVSVTATGPLVAETKAVEKSVKKHKSLKETVTVAATDAKGLTTTLTQTVTAK